MSYEVNIPGAEITLHNPDGTVAIGCFWAKRDSQRVLKYVTPDVAVVGNIYHNRFVDPYQMELSAHKVARALWWNPQIKLLTLVSSDAAEIDRFRDCLGRHIVIETVSVDASSFTVALLPDRVKVDYPLPEVEEPDTYPYKYDTGHVLRGDNLTELHCDVLRHVLRYGEATPTPRLEVQGLYSEWRAPFKLGHAYESSKAAWDVYSNLMPEPGTEPVEYTYPSRIKGTGMWYRGDYSRSNYYPIWVPGDEDHTDPPCMVSMYVRRGVAYGIFRAHNLLNAWPKNAYLVKSQGEFISGEPLKAVVLISLQGGIRPEDQEAARAHVEEYGPEGKPDIHGRGGSWVFCKDGEEGVAQLLGPTGILQEIHGKSSLEIRQKITALDAWPADMSECAYIGDQLRGLFQ